MRQFTPLGPTILLAKAALSKYLGPKGADETIAEYALRDTTAPIQISEYRTQPLPEPYRDALPSAERLVEHLRQLPMPKGQGRSA